MSALAAFLSSPGLVVVAPFLLLMGTGAASLLIRPHRARRIVAVLGALSALGAAAILVRRVWVETVLTLEVGSWAPPFGITLVADPLAAAMVAVTAVILLAVLLYHAVDGTEGDGREREPLILLLGAGVTLSFITGDLFNLYVAFEVLLVASFGLLVGGSTRDRVRGAGPYVLINLVGSALFLVGTAILYGLTGALNMAEMSTALAQHPDPGLVTAASTLLLLAFGLKAAVFPIFFWLPASYHTPPPAVAALFAGLLTKVGVYALVRTFTLLFVQDPGYTHGLLAWAAGFTMITGVLGAASQTDVRRILSFHIVSQIGYMVMGLALLTPLALTGTVFYIVHHIVVKANLFLVGGAMAGRDGIFDLSRLGGLFRARPGLAVLFLIPALSLAGVPPLSGFWAKLLILRAGLEAEAWALVTVAAVAGLLTLYSMTKIWARAFWAPVDAEDTPSSPGGETGTSGPGSFPPGLLVPMAGLAAITLAIGLWAEPLALLAERAASTLLDPGPYLDAVLGSPETAGGSASPGTAGTAPAPPVPEPGGRG